MNLNCLDQLVGAITGVLVVALCDYLAGANVGLWVAYLIPIGVAGWACGVAAAAVCTALASIFLFVVGYLVGHPFPSYWYYAFASSSEVLALVVVMMGKIRALVFRVRDLESAVGGGKLQSE